MHGRVMLLVALALAACGNAVVGRTDVVDARDGTPELATEVVDAADVPRKDAPVPDASPDTPIPAEIEAPGPSEVVDPGPEVGEVVDTGGVAVGGDERIVNAAAQGDQAWPTVAALADGRFVVAFQSGLPSGKKRVLVRCLDAQGGWLAVWASKGQDGAGWAVVSRRFAAP
jgi:hypothetical protein